MLDNNPRWSAASQSLTSCLPKFSPFSMRIRREAGLCPVGDILARLQDPGAIPFRQLAAGIGIVGSEIIQQEALDPGAGHQDARRKRGPMSGWSKRSASATVPTTAIRPKVFRFKRAAS